MSLKIVVGNIYDANVGIAIDPKSLTLDKLKEAKTFDEKMDAKNLLDDCSKLNERKVFITTSSEFKAAKVIKIVEPMVQRDLHEYKFNPIQILYSDAIALAVKEEVKSLAMPLVNCDESDLPVGENIRIALNALTEFSQTFPDKEVLFVLKEGEEFDCYKQLHEGSDCFELDENGLVKPLSSKDSEDLPKEEPKKEENISKSEKIIFSGEKDEEPKKDEKVKKEEEKVPFFTLPTKIVLVLCLMIVMIGKMFPVVRVVGDSMYPTYKSGNFLVTTRQVDEVQRGDIVYFSLSKHIEDKEVAKKESKHYMVKRIVGMPGDSLICKDGTVYVNGKKEENAPNAPCEPEGMLENGVTLKNNEYFVMGDNRTNSFDSRSYGPINKEDMKGVIKYNIFGFFKGQNGRNK